ncbi:hypothetical protein QBA35_00965 [Streptomyces bottropensis]|jgi:hypothetical protein|uniref:Uncharacterized protein n=1 Tax=Streptomyces bottropensis TaxID=42235 RepID=A0ABU8AF69_9ACTN
MLIVVHPRLALRGLLLAFTDRCEQRDGRRAIAPSVHPFAFTHAIIV